VNYFADVEVDKKRIIGMQKSGIANKSASWEYKKKKSTDEENGDKSTEQVKKK
jgi:hypothetical protein